MKKKILSCVVAIVLFCTLCGLLYLGAELDKQTLFVEKVWPDGPIVRVLDYKGQEVDIDIGLKGKKYEVIWVAPEHFRK